MKKETFTPSQALPKIKHYCAYQERCHQEVKEKLYGYGLNSSEAEEIIATLISEKYLNEQRFAELFASGRFRLKHWGKIKIRYELKQKFVSDHCIRQALLQIDLDEYEKILGTIAVQKWRTLKGERNIFVKKRKAVNYLLQKGFGSDLWIAEITK